MKLTMDGNRMSSISVRGGWADSTSAPIGCSERSLGFRQLIVQLSGGQRPVINTLRALLDHHSPGLVFAGGSRVRNPRA